MKIKNSALGLLTILTLGVILRLINLNQSLWLDEAAQAIESSGSFTGLFQIKADFMPPLFHILLFFWLRISHAEWFMRLLSVSFAVGTIYFTYLSGKKFFSRNVALLSTLLLSVAPFHIFYSQELRPYALSAFLSTASTFYLLENRQGKYIVSSILFIYSLYTSFFLLLGHGAFMFFFRRNQFMAWLKAIVIVTLSFVPWLPIFKTQLSGGQELLGNLSGWSQVVSVEPFKALALTLAKFTLGRITFDNKLFYAGLFVVILILVMSIVKSSWRSNKNSTRQLLAILLIPLFLIFVFSFFLPVIAPQRILFLLPYFLILVASGIDASKPPWKGIFLLGFLVVNFLGLFLYYSDRRFGREQWREATAYVEGMADSDTQVIFAFPEPFAPYLWYREKTNLGVGVAKNFAMDSDDIVYLEQATVGKKTLFIFDYLTDLTDPNDVLERVLTKQGFNKISTRDFPGVGFIYEYRK